MAGALVGLKSRQEPLPLHPGELRGPVAPAAPLRWRRTWGAGAGTDRGICCSQSVNSMSALLGFGCSFGLDFVAREPHS